MFFFVRNFASNLHLNNFLNYENLMDEFYFSFDLFARNFPSQKFFAAVK